MAPLKELTQLQRLELSGADVTDAGLEHLKGLTQLQRLVLTGTRVSDAGLEHLRRLTQLQLLNLAHTQVTDAGLEHLKGLAQLKELNLSYTHVTDAGLEHLKGLTQLRALKLRETNVTDEGVKATPEGVADLLDPKPLFFLTSRSLLRRKSNPIRPSGLDSVALIFAAFFLEPPQPVNRYGAGSRKSRWALAVVVRSSSSRVLPRSSARRRALSRIWAGSLRFCLPRRGCGTR